MKEKITVIFSFILIFAFSSVDNSISPLVKQISVHYLLPMEIVLKFISVCTLGTVIGVLIGPYMVSVQKPSILLFFSSLMLLAFQLVFVFFNNVFSGMISRFMSGISTGVVASVMWWLAYHGISKKYYPSMIAVLMSARPLAVAIGVPLSALMAWKFSWTVPYILLSFVIFFSGLILSKVLPEKKVVSEVNIFSAYKEVFSIPYVKRFYSGFTINKMCYFGFYAMAGIWFIEHYKLNLKDISFALFIIGIAEVFINFMTFRVINKFGYKFTFNFSIFISFITLLFFIWGRLNLQLAIFLIAIFMLLDRVYSTALVLKIPDIFPQRSNKTIFGSLNTLSAWLGLSLVSGLSSKIIPVYGIFGAEILLFLSFIIGTSLIYYVQIKTITDKTR